MTEVRGQKTEVLEFGIGNAECGLRAHRAQGMVHSVQIENAEISEKSDALPYAPCAMHRVTRNQYWLNS